MVRSCILLEWVVDECWPDGASEIVDEVIVVSLGELFFGPPVIVFGHSVFCQVCVDVYQFSCGGVCLNRSQQSPIFIELGCLQSYYFSQYHFL